MMRNQVAPSLWRTFTFCLVLAASTEAFAASIECTDASDTCAGDHGSIFAIAHDWNRPETHVLFRVTVPAWSVAADWTGTHNGFFYQAVAHHADGSSESRYYVPFNGIRIGADRQPEIPAFDFIVPVDVSEPGTSLEIQACSSDSAYTGSVKTPTCSKQFWSDPYASPLPPPEIPPTSALNNNPLTLSPASVSIADNGVYTESVVLNISSSLTAEQLQFQNDHLVFFYGNGDVYTNDLFNDRVGVLSYDEVTYIDSPSQNHRTRYGSGVNLTKAAAPNRNLFVFALGQDPATAQLGLSVIYDKSETCTGEVPQAGSKNPNCPATTASFSVSPKLTITAVDWTPDESSGELNGTPAGAKESRDFQLKVVNGGPDCSHVVSPLAIYPASNGNGAHRPPNYVIDPQPWSDAFPIGLYYVVDSGFGNCNVASSGPFCQRTAGLYSYVPHYYSGAAFGDRNGGGTSAEHITGMILADEYALGNINTATTNTLIYFDSCGYSHTYMENNSGKRLTLPSAPGDWSSSLYNIANVSGHPLNFGKECCASWYHPNANDSSVLEPPHQIDNSFAMYVGGGQSRDYSTLFSEETSVVYDALTGDRLYKLYLNAANTKLYACSDSSDASQSVRVVSGNQLRLGDTASGKLGCTSPSTCPFGLTSATSGSLVTCTQKFSSFLLGLQDWGQSIKTNAVQIMAWGAKGHSSSFTADDGKGQGYYTVAGEHGFALTVAPPADLPTALYAYVGTEDDHGSGGTATLVTASPLSAFGSSTAEGTTDPSTMNVYLIAGGSGSAGNKHDGGAGGLAIANQSSLPGAAKSAAGQTGGGNNGGGGGNKDGQGSEGGQNAVTGVGGIGGSGSNWKHPASLILPNISPLPDWSAGHGSHGNDTGGGGGFGGGAHASESSAGAGGGGSWALGNTAHDSTAPAGVPTSPNGNDGTVQLAYVKTASATAPGPDSTNVVSVTYDTSYEPLDLAALINVLFGPNVNSDLPLCIEAWGGSGGRGSTYGSLSQGGAGGYAAGCYRLGDLPGDGHLYLYVGAKGADGDVGRPGRGGASTLVSTEPLSKYHAHGDDFQPDSIGLLALAGGGGGGGTAAEEILNLYSEGAINGGRGGIALGSLLSHVSCGGEVGGYLSSSVEAGAGGNGGGLLCADSGPAKGGDGGFHTGAGGGRGLGGFGGVTDKKDEPAGWLGSHIDKWKAGNGGDSSADGGAGGGGLGGGGGGGSLLNHPFGGSGGGGGGSWTRRAGLAALSHLLRGQEHSSSEQGAVVLSFDICAVDPASPFCSASFTRVDANIEISQMGGHGPVRVLLKGSATLDVSQIDVTRIGFGPGVVPPEKVGKDRRDRNGDGFADLELQFHENALSAPDLGESVECIYMALLDNTPLIGCGRLETPEKPLLPGKKAPKS